MHQESTQNTQLGDLIQIVTDKVEAENEDGEMVVHGVRGAIAHVTLLELDGVVEAWFERTRSISIVFPYEYKRLCSGSADELGARGPLHKP